MKKIFSISFLFLALGQAFLLSLVSLYLELERDYFAENYCINRLEPELMCSGSCYILEVTEDLFPAEGNDPAPAQNQVDRMPITLFAAAVPMTSKNHPVFYNELVDCYQARYSYLHTSSLFHPPRV